MGTLLVRGDHAAAPAHSEPGPNASGLGGLKPPFRWPGGKRWLVPQLRQLVRVGTAHYYEPFFGAGALFFALLPGQATISDRNSELMNCYSVIRDYPEALGRYLRQMETGPDAFYATRSSRPTDHVARAARLVYLVSLGFNGIYRVNLRGEFNVPYSGRTRIQLSEQQSIDEYSHALQGVEIAHGDFADAVSTAGVGDFIYLDPPYTVAHDNNGFVKYNSMLFSWRDQERLADVVRDLDQRGCWVVVSSAHHASTESLFHGFRSVSVARTSTIAASALSRGVRQEYLITNVPDA